MATDDERHEAAERLRDGVKSKTECELLSLNGSSAAIRWLISYVVFGDKKYHSGVDLLGRLADLIDPDTTTDTTKPAAVSPERDGMRERLARALGIDLPALLKLAEEMRRNTRGMLSDDKVDASDIWYYEHLLRKACGEEAS